jgi:hypothetical protein
MSGDYSRSPTEEKLSAASANNAEAKKNDRLLLTQKERDGQSTIVHVESAEITTDEHLIRFRITAVHFFGRW